MTFRVGQKKRSLRWVAMVLAVLLLGMALRWHLWGRFRLREDEALYGYWAWLIYSGIDPLLKTAPVDKPPLFPYMLSWLYGVFYPSEVTLRVPGLWAGTLSLALIYGWARDLAGKRVAVTALVLYAMMPLNILMAPTGYMDTLMIAWLLLSVWLAGRRGRFSTLWTLLAGGAFALGITTKPLALLWLPIPIITAWHRKQPLIRWGTLFVVGASMPLWRWWQWEQIRGAPSTLQMAVIHYGGMGILLPSLWLEQVRDWLHLLVLSWGGAPPFVLMGILLGMSGLRAVHMASSPSLWRLLWCWLLGMITLFVVTVLQPWDRYLILIAPVFVLLLAHGWEYLSPRLTMGWRIAALLIVLWTGGRAGNAAYPVGGDHGAYDGIDQVASYVMAELPPGGIIYHHWLGWHYGFYLFGAPYDFRWWPDVAWLVQDSARNDGVPRLLIVPAWHERERFEIVRSMEAAGVSVRLVKRIYDQRGKIHFWIYSINKPGTGSLPIPGRSMHLKLCSVYFSSGMRDKLSTCRAAISLAIGSKSRQGPVNPSSVTP